MRICAHISEHRFRSYERNVDSARAITLYIRNKTITISNLLVRYRARVTVIDRKKNVFFFSIPYILILSRDGTVVSRESRLINDHESEVGLLVRKRQIPTGILPAG